MATLGDVYVVLKVQLEKFQAGMGQATGMLNKFASGVGALGQKLTSLGTQFSIMGAAMSAAIAKPIKETASWEREFSKIKVLANATTEEMEALKKASLDLSAKFPFTATQIAAGMVEAVKAGRTAQETLEQVAITLEFATANTIKFDDANKILNRTLGVFALKVEDSQRVVDVLTRAAADSTTEIADLGESIDYGGGLARAAGVSIEEFSAMLVTLSSQVRGSRAGTGIEAMFREIARSAAGIDKKTAAGLENLGIVLSDLDPKFHNIIDIIKRLKQEDLTVLKALTVPFDPQAARTVGAMTDFMDLFTDSLKRMKGAAGLARSASEQMLSDMQGGLDLVKNSVVALQIVFIETFGKQIKDGLVGIAAFVAKIREWVDTNKELAAQLGVVFLKVTGISLALGGILVPLGIFLGWVSNAVAGFASLGAAIGKLFTPMGALIATIVAVVIATIDNIRNRWDEFSVMFEGIWGKVINIFNTMMVYGARLWESLKNSFKAIGFLVAEVVRAHEPWIDIFLDLVNAILPLVISLLAAFLDGLSLVVTVLGKFVSVGIEAVKTVYNMADGFVRFITGAKSVSEELKEQAEVTELLGRIYAETGLQIEKLRDRMGGSIGVIGSLTRAREDYNKLLAKGTELTLADLVEMQRLRDIFEGNTAAREDALKTFERNIRIVKELIANEKELGLDTSDHEKSLASLEAQLDRYNKSLTEEERLYREVSGASKLRESGLKAETAAKEETNRVEQERLDLLKQEGQLLAYIEAIEKKLIDQQLSNSERKTAQIEKEFATRIKGAEDTLKLLKIQGKLTEKEETRLKDFIANVTKDRQDSIDALHAEEVAKTQKKNDELLKDQEEFEVAAHRSMLEAQGEKDELRRFDIAQELKENKEKLAILYKDDEEKFNAAMFQAEELAKAQTDALNKEIAEREKNKHAATQVKDIEDQVLDTLKNQVKTLRDLMALRMAQKTIEAEAVKYASILATVRNDLMRAEAVGDTEKTERLRRQIDFLEQFTQKRNKEAGINVNTGIVPDSGNMETVITMNQRIIAAVKVMAEKVKEIMRDLASSTKDLAIKAMDNYLSGLKEGFENIIKFIKDAMEEVKRLFHPDTKGSPSLNDNINMSIEAVAKGLKTIGDSITSDVYPIGHMIGDAISQSIGARGALAVPNTNVAGVVSRQSSETVNDHRSVSMVVNSALDAEEVARVTKNALNRSSLLAGGF